MQIAPKEDELKGLLAYAGPLSALSAPERFLCVMARVPRLLDKINLLILRGTFQARNWVPGLDDAISCLHAGS